MRTTTFFKQLTLISIPSGALLIALHQLPALQEHLGIALISLTLFILLCIFMFYAGRAAAAQENKNTFTNAFLIFLMLKLFLCAGLMIGYLKIVEPDNKLFVLPFFGLYIIYTTFEVFFLIKIGRIRSK